MAGASLVHVPAVSAHASFDVDWRVEAGAPIAPGQALAHLCAQGRCGLFDVAAPAAGTLVYRWSSLVVVVRPGDAVGVVAEAGGGALVAACARAEAARLDELLRARTAEASNLAARIDPMPRSLARSLLERDAAELKTWLDAARTHRARLRR